MRLMYVHTIEARSSKRPAGFESGCSSGDLHVGRGTITVSSQFSQTLFFGWRLLRERRLSAQGECSTGGDVFATVAAAFTTI
jgi:hypothetical protein